jgi:ATP phosphoribosyltransferase
MENPKQLSMLIPKGRLQNSVVSLLADVGVKFHFGARSYRPTSSDPEISAKLLKPQNIASLVSLGRHDVGFVGHDWILELGLDGPESGMVEVMDLEFDPVRLVAAVPDHFISNGTFRAPKPMVVASEYERLTRRYIEDRGYEAVFVKTFGATEALPPEDADMIVDNTSTGATLVSNRLEIVDELLVSTTRLVAHRSVLEDPWKKSKLERMIMLIRSTLDAKLWVLLEMNIAVERLDDLVAALPAMRSPTVAPLFGDQGYAVKVAVPSKESPTLIPSLRKLGATGILEYRLQKIVP